LSDLFETTLELQTKSRSTLEFPPFSAPLPIPEPSEELATTRESEIERIPTDEVDPE
jgi:hypothetical protein